MFVSSSRSIVPMSSDGITSGSTSSSEVLPTRSLQAVDCSTSTRGGMICCNPETSRLSQSVASSSSAIASDETASIESSTISSSSKTI